MGKIQGFFGEPLKHVITVRGHIWVSRIDDPSSAPRVYIQNVPMCTFKTSPCVPAPRPHVETHVRVVQAYTGTFWMDTRVFQRVTPLTPHHTAHTHTPRLNINNHNNTRRQRQRKKTEKERGRREDERRKTREGKTRRKRRQEKTREDKRRSREDQDERETKETIILLKNVDNTQICQMN